MGGQDLLKYGVVSTLNAAITFTGTHGTNGS